jgi:thiamine biosynthesis lipoprotein
VIEAHAFRAMGTDIELFVRSSNRGATEAFTAVEAEFERLEQIMSRFRPDSELSQLNRAGALEVSADLAHVIALALAARERTAGRFDPCIYDALVAAGYDRTFAEVAPDGADTAQVEPICGGGASVDGRRVELEDGAKLDLGGIGKGYAAERAAGMLGAVGPCLVAAGGDIAVRGGHSWPVGVETGEGVVTLELERGALATSGSDRRRWVRNGEERHHLIDPRTGRSAASDVLRVTAFADDAVQAEVLTKLLFLAGAEEAEESGATAIVVTRSGETILTGGFA